MLFRDVIRVEDFGTNSWSNSWSIRWIMLDIDEPPCLRVNHKLLKIFKVFWGSTTNNGDLPLIVVNSADRCDYSTGPVMKRSGVLRHPENTRSHETLIMNRNSNMSSVLQRFRRFHVTQIHCCPCYLLMRFWAIFGDTIICGIFFPDISGYVDRYQYHRVVHVEITTTVLLVYSF